MANPPVSKESSVSSDFSDVVQHKNKRNAFKNGAAAILYASNGKALPVSASPNEPANGSDQEMPLLMYQTWFDAIESDDIESAKRILTGVRTEVDIMLNGKFQFHYFTSGSKNKIWKQKNKTLPCFFQRPVVLAAVFRSKEVLKFILNQGADIYLNDGGDNNIIHAIVWGAALQPEFENEYKEIYLMITDSLSRQEQKSLLMRENADGLRPLELAARLTTFYLFITIFNTEGVYVHNKGRLGAYVCKWYDVTDYESIEASTKSRRNRSPLRIFTFIEKERLQNASTRDIMLNNKAISKWIDIKIQSNTPHLIVWFLARLSYTMLFLVYANSNYEDSNSSSNTYDSSSTSILTSSSSVHSKTDTRNITSNDGAVQNGRCSHPLFTISNTVRQVTLYITLIYSLFIVIFDISETMFAIFTRNRDKRCQHVQGSRHFVVRTKFYRVCNFLLGVFVLLFILGKTKEWQGLMTKSFMIANILNIWSLLFFIQFVPALGHFVTIIQRMFKDMFHFLVLYILLFFSFSQTFHNLFYIKGICTDEFKDPFMSTYSSFRVMLNMLELTDLKIGNITDVAILHVAYVIIVPILLVNFLIALMSNSVSEVAENRYLIMALQRLSAALQIETRFGMHIPFLYKYIQEKLLVTSEGRVYVECFALKDSNAH